MNKMYFLYICFTFADTTNKMMETVMDLVYSIDNLKRTSKFVGVVDAGSTGTRLNIFGYKVPENILYTHEKVESNKNLHTLNTEESVHEVLNSLFNTGKTIMLEKGIKIEDVPFAFHATGGARLNNAEQQIKLCKMVKNFFKNNKYDLKECSIIPGNEEGVYGLESIKALNIIKNRIFKRYGCNNNYIKFRYANQLSDICTNEFNEGEDSFYGVIEMGGASLQMAYEFDKNDKYKSPIHVIKNADRNIFIDSFDGWGMKEATKIFKAFQNYSLYRNHEKKTIFTELMKDFKNTEKPDINKVNKLYLIAYFYERFRKLGCKEKTSLDEIRKLFEQECSLTRCLFCDETLYLISFLENIGIEAKKELIIAKDIVGMNLNWSMARSLLMLE